MKEPDKTVNENVRVKTELCVAERDAFVTVSVDIHLRLLTLAST